MSNDLENGINHKDHQVTERESTRSKILKVLTLLVIGGILTEAGECTGIPQRVVFKVREDVGSTLKNIGETIEPDVVPTSNPYNR